MKYSFNFYSQNINESNKEYNISKEFSIFKNLVEKEIKPNIYKTDWLIYSPEHEVVGSVDAVFKDADGSYTMCDWIRTNKLIDEVKNIIPSHDYGRGIYGMNNMVDNEYNKYCLKQNIHKYILEKYYNLKIETMYLVIVHPDYSRCYSIYIPDRQNEAEYMLQNKHLVIKEN